MYLRTTPSSFTSSCFALMLSLLLSGCGGSNHDDGMSGNSISKDCEPALDANGDPVPGGCGDSNHDGLSGSWITENCEQALNSSGEPVEIWLRASYQFTAEGTIEHTPREYLDANCVSLKQKILTTTPEDVLVTYSDSGLTKLEEGIDGHALNITVESSEHSLSVDAFYTRQEERLCFSEAFTFRASRFGISESGRSSIDFDHCLLPNSTEPAPGYFTKGTKVRGNLANKAESYLIYRTAH